ncbi:hypothetical protein QUB19_29570 [Microcoleus sp. B4-C5]
MKKISLYNIEVFLLVGRSLHVADFSGKWQGKHGLARSSASLVSKQQAHK